MGVFQVVVLVGTLLMALPVATSTLRSYNADRLRRQRQLHLRREQARRAAEREQELRQIREINAARDRAIRTARAHAARVSARQQVARRAA